MSFLTDIGSNLSNLWNNDVAKPIVNTLHNVGQGAINIEQQNPVYGSFMQGIRGSMSPLLQNIPALKQSLPQATQQLQQRNPGFNQQQPGVVNSVARFAGGQVPYVIPTLATGAVFNPLTSRLAAEIPAGASIGAKIIAGAAKGALQTAPYGLMAGLPATKTGQERADNIRNGVLQSIALGGAGGAVGTATSAGLGAVKNNLMNVLMQKHGMTPAQADATVTQWARDNMGRFTGQKITKPAPVYPSDIKGGPPSGASGGVIISNARQRQMVYGDLNQAVSDMLSKGQSGKIDFGAEISNPLAKDRGLVTSVQESPTISDLTKTGTQAQYTPKPNSQLQNEAMSLLNEGTSIDFKHIASVDQKVAATIQQAINLDKSGNHEAAANLFNNLSEHGTELGRGVQAFSMLNKMSPEAIALSAAGKIKAYNATHGAKIPELNGNQLQLISQKVDAIQNMPTGREKNIAMNDLHQTVNSFIPSSLADKFLAVWKAGLLTSLRTHERNLFGNAIMQGSEIAKDPIATLADKAMSLKTGQRTQTTTLQGLGQFGSQETRQQVADQVTKGFDASSPINKFETKNINWGNNPLEQGLKHYTDIVFRTLGAEDKPFYNAAMARSLYDQAGAQAINAGKRGDSAFIANLVHNPTPEMAKQAVIDANTATFKDQNKLSGLASALKQYADKNWYTKLPAEIIAPFTGVPSSIVGKTIAYSPIGLLKGAIDAGRVVAGNVPDLQRQAAQEIGRGVLGTGLFGLGAYLMSKGLMTGQPKDAQESALWQAEGKQANSVLVDGKWRSIGSIGPQNLVMLAGQKYQEEMGKPDGSGSLGTFAANLGKDQLNQTFLQGVSGPLNAITDPARYGSSYIGNTANSVIPNLVKDTAKANDPMQRENNSLSDYMTNSIPFLRNQNLPKRDNLGNVMPQEPTGAGAFLDLFNSKTPISNPVVSEIDRLSQTGNNALPGKIGKSQTIQGVKQTLNPAQINNLEAQVGPETQQQIASLIKDPSYQTLDDAQKANAIQSIVASTRKQVRGTINISSSPTSQAQNTPGISSGTKKFTVINPDTGTVKTIDLSKSIPTPALTGNQELDKKLTASYNSALTTRANDIVTLYKNGKIDAPTAEQYLEQVQKTIQSKTTTAGTKRVAVKKMGAIAKISPLKSTVLKLQGATKKLQAMKISKQPKLTMGKTKQAARFKIANPRIYLSTGKSSQRGIRKAAGISVPVARRKAAVLTV